ncbi:hypothetical protein LEMLEM_LOCUS10479 [Lemmus lemmus]
MDPRIFSITTICLSVTSTDTTVFNWLCRQYLWRPEEGIRSR